MSPSPKARKPRVAYFSPLSPDPSGVSDYSEELLPHLSKLWEVDLFVDGYQPTHAATRDHRVIDCDQVDPIPLLAGYDAVLYHVGNSESHDYIYDTLLRWPGLVVLHELSLQHLMAFRTIDAGRKDVYMSEMRRQHGREGADRARQTLWGGLPAPWEAEPIKYPLNRRAISQATGVLAHSDLVERGVHEVFPDLLVHRVDHHAFPVPSRARELARARKEERSRGVCTFVSAGNLTPSKQIEILLRALGKLRGSVPFECRLIGEGRLKHKAEHLIGSLGLAGHVEVEGRVDKDELYCALLESDLSVCLRKPTLGETSGIVMRSLACGTPVLVSDTGWFRELPDQVALKVSPDARGGGEITRVLERFVGDSKLRRSMSKAARAYARQRSPRASAEGYASFVATAGLFPNRWAGRGYQRITARFRDLDVEWPGCAAKLRATLYAEMTDWHDRGSEQALIDRRSRRLSRLRKAARAESRFPWAPRRVEYDDEDVEDELAGGLA